MEIPGGIPIKIEDLCGAIFRENWYRAGGNLFCRKCKGEITEQTDFDSEDKSCCKEAYLDYALARICGEVARKIPAG